MEHPIIGLDFRPTDVELLCYYLRLKHLGKNELVDKAIKEVDIYSFPPWELPSQVLRYTTDHVGYFFARRDASGGDDTKQTRTTSWGKWKSTGPVTEIKDVHGSWEQPGTIIGTKRILTFKTKEEKSESKSKKSVVVKKQRRSDGKKSAVKESGADWIIHEYIYSLVEEKKRIYVVCRLEYKGRDRVFIKPTDYTTMRFVQNPISVADLAYQANHDTTNANLQGIPNHSNNTMVSDWGISNKLFNESLSYKLPEYSDDFPMYNTYGIGESSQLHQTEDSIGDLQRSSNWNYEDDTNDLWSYMKKL